MSKAYKAAIQEAKEILADARARGDDALGRPWSELRKELYAPDEIIASDMRVAIMIAISEARREKGLSQRKLEELSGVRQPVIARMENGTNNPGMDNVLRVLAPLGKTLRIVDIDDVVTSV
ncbi:MAG: helix-turn-helix transcriptional regulator [Defluviitaleaceae bacterium]|nr:helix-turn-helix transcriptional regulator [Defluviitaleaceae bacterium]